MFRFTVPLHSLACGIILVSKLYYVHYHPCPNPRKHAILTREKKNFVIPTVVMAHQKRFQVFLTSGERRPTGEGFSCPSRLFLCVLSTPLDRGYCFAVRQDERQRLALRAQAR